jgi:Arc/MetJ-type ribon-helix-helix transcriptional regulator
MQVDLTLEQQSFVQEAIKSGRLRRPEAAVHQALAMWEEQKRTLNWQQSLWTRPQL